MNRGEEKIPKLKINLKRRIPNPESDQNRVPRKESTWMSNLNFRHFLKKYVQIHELQITSASVKKNPLYLQRENFRFESYNEK